jgi:enoyl-CoA hydratase/carnithine racemase
MEFKDIIFEKKGHVATITLNHPEKYNALSFNCYKELMQAFEDIEKDREVKVVVIKARGKAFCAGADLSDLGTLAGGQKESPLTEQAKPSGRGPYEVIENCTKPVIAAVQGMALAGGLELLLVCDIVIASEEARLGDQHANFGLVPGGGATQRLPRLIGIRKAKELLFTGDWISPQEAERIGLVNKVVPADKLDEAVEELCRKLVNKSYEAASAVKRLVYEGMQTDLETGLGLERKAVAAHFSSETFKEGVKSFLEKRKPDFSKL